MHYPQETVTATTVVQPAVQETTTTTTVVEPVATATTAYGYGTTGYGAGYNYGGYNAYGSVVPPVRPISPIGGAVAQQTTTTYTSNTGPGIVPPVGTTGYGYGPQGAYGAQGGYGAQQSYYGAQQSTY